jgi:putative ABC transport system permease protein
MDHTGLEMDSVGRSTSRARERLDEEIRFHLDQQTEKNRRAGMTPDEARRQALLRFGGLEPVKESTRDEIRPALLEDSVRDIRHGGRVLRAPGSTAAAVVTPALTLF